MVHEPTHQLVVTVQQQKKQLVVHQVQLVVPVHQVPVEWSGVKCGQP